MKYGARYFWESVEDGRSAARVADFLEKSVSDVDKRDSLEGQAK